MFRILCIFAIWIGWSSYHPIRGKSVAPSIISMTDVIKSTDNMTKMKPLAQVLKEFRNVHGDRYIYTEINETNYHGSKSVVPIICREHGLFQQLVDKHLLGHGCRTCAKRKDVKDLLFGVARYDIENIDVLDDSTKLAHDTWGNMLWRCYDSNFHTKQPTYKDCSVCEEWLLFSNFKKWFDENYVAGYQLDKDILVKGNKVYSPDTCCFIPQRLNTILTKPSKSKRHGLIGVRKRSNGRFGAVYTKDKKCVWLGTYGTEIEAFEAYKHAKESYVKDVAQEYYDKGLIKESVYNALMRFRVNIDD